MTKSLKNGNELKNLNAFQLEYEEDLKDTQSLGAVLRHKKSGARICIVSNDDDNKVFFIGFRTPPADSTGVAHIIEHTVLCGSKNFPAKDPFIELTKGSLNTFLNAMTYSDKTVYPIASCNDQDFQNLMHVYMDAVFYPNIYKGKEIFEQEGWHYELENKDAELKINGIVYSEMKGAFSSPESQLFREIQASLYPDTSYGVESGGNPDFIPDLTYDAYLDFHRKYYHPANSYIYLYGNMDVIEKLEWLDKEYLSHFEPLSVDSEIPEQKAFKESKKIESFYSLSDSEEEKGNTYLTYNIVTGKSVDVKLCYALQILESALLSSPGAPLKQALIDAGIGKDILSSVDTELLQPNFTIIAKNADYEQNEQFVSIIRTKLEEIVKEGINEKSIRAALNNLEFKYREADFGQFPKGLLNGLQMMGTWLYDDTKAFAYMHGNDVFAELKKEIGTGYYEELIRKCLLDNTHMTNLILRPKKGLNTAKEEALKEKLASYKNSLTDEEKEQLVLNTKNLIAYQETPSTKEELEKIPLLNREDIEKEAPKLYNTVKSAKDMPVIHHEVFTNGISYVKGIFGLSEVEKDLLPYLNFFSSVLGYMDTTNYSFLELANEVNIYTGGISTDLTIFNKKNDPDYYRPVFMMSVKMLYEQTEKAFELMKEIILETKFEDSKRLLEIIREIKSRLQMKMNSSGHNVAVDRAFSYFEESGYYNDVTKGIGYYRFISELEENFEDRKEELVKNLKRLVEQIFNKESAVLSITAEEEGYEKAAALIPSFMDAIDHGRAKAEKTEDGVPFSDRIRPAHFGFQYEKKNEGFKYSGQVQYVACAGNYIAKGFEPTGALKILRMILSYDYLWNNIRVKGGAYGCMCSFSGMDGSSYMVSYRDPNLKETKDVYEHTYDYIKNFNVDERDMTKYIIGTMSMVDTPLTPMMKGSRSLNAYMSNVSMDDIQKDRDQILSAGVADIQALADLVKAVVDQDNFCVIGNEAKIAANEDLFKEVKPLM
ncbi:MAG: insulinase family protein [Lachnospiraceae bacterium]|nr:insulinase family protein [Lachnospiraceae bacterium]